MEWLDFILLSFILSFNFFIISGFSIFNIDFLDVTDFNLNFFMDFYL